MGSGKLGYGRTPLESWGSGWLLPPESWTESTTPPRELDVQVSYLLRRQKMGLTICTICRKHALNVLLFLNVIYFLKCYILDTPWPT